MHTQAISSQYRPVEPTVLVPLWAGGYVPLSVHEAASLLAWWTVRFRSPARESATTAELRGELSALLREHGMTGVREAMRGLAEFDVDPDDLADTAWWQARAARLAVAR